MTFVTPATSLRSLLLGGVLLVLAALAAAARPAAATTSPLRTCTNAAWADYNDCLMETDSWWVRKGCDIAFEAEYVRCYAYYYKDIS